MPETHLKTCALSISLSVPNTMPVCGGGQNTIHFTHNIPSYCKLYTLHIMWSGKINRKIPKLFDFTLVCYNTDACQIVMFGFGHSGCYAAAHLHIDARSHVDVVVGISMDNCGSNLSSVVATARSPVRNLRLISSICSWTVTKRVKRGKPRC